MVGGLVRLFIDKKKFANEADREKVANSGIIFSSGMIAGEGLVGILLALFAVIPVKGTTLGALIDVSGKISLGQIGSLIAFAVLLALILKFSLWNKKVYTDYDEEDK